MNDKQYLEAVDKLLGAIYPLTQFYSDLASLEELQPVNDETLRRIAALEAQ